MRKQLKIFRNLFLGNQRESYWVLILLLVPNLIAACLEGLSFGLILLSFQLLTGEKQLPFHSWLDTLSNHQLFIFFIILAIGSQICRSILAYIGQTAVLSFSLKIQTQMLKDVYGQILRFSFPFVNQYKIGDLLEYIKTPSHLISHIMDRANRILVSGFAIAVLVGVLFYISAPLTVLAMVIFGALFVSQKLIFKKISLISGKLTEDTVDFSRHITQSLHGLKLIHTFMRQSYMLKKVYGIIEQIKESSRRLNFWNQALLPINETMGIILVGLFLVLGQFIIHEESKEAISMLLTFILIIYRLNTRMQMLLVSTGEIVFHWGSIVRLEEILDAKDKKFSDHAGLNHPLFKHEVVFHQVSLQYPNTLKPALEGLHFTIPRGKITALVGISGAGKSSIIDLILRLYQPSQGKITVDGLDLETINMEKWRELLGVVSQDIFIFPETIEENIRFGFPEASFDAVIHAAKLAGAHEFISGLPEKYATLLGERGYRLSGGEKQKLALARALIRDPEILVLDEASSSLDTHSELVIQNALYSLKGKKTIILIAHRLSTVKNADTIFVIEKGKMIENGSHIDLIEKNGRYAYFWKLQSIDQEHFVC